MRLLLPVGAGLRPPADQHMLEGYIVAQYGRRLYSHFFESYTETVWGVPAREISADWGAQRIKDMSLFRAVWEPIRARVVGRRDKSHQVTSLIEEFQYPKYGPGMMWERCRDLVEAAGVKIQMDTEVTTVEHHDGRAVAVTGRSGDTGTEFPADHVISSMPFPRLVQAMAPAPPPEVLAAADQLKFRDFVTVALVVPESAAFPDNWIYIHSPEVRPLGRIQNFGAWSPYLVKDGRTCLGLEYFVFEGDDVWNSSDDELVARGHGRPAPPRPGRCLGGRVGLRGAHAQGLSRLRRGATGPTSRSSRDGWPPTPPTCTRSGATGCTSTTTRTTRCSRPC